MLLEISSAGTHFVNVDQLFKFLRMVIHFHVETVSVSCLDPAHCQLDLFLMGAILLDVVVSFTLQRGKVLKVAHCHNRKSKENLPRACS
jgi:hypothetical protein